MPSYPLNFSLNHMVAPSLSPIQLLEAAAELGLSAVELRTDIGDNSLTSLNEARAIGAKAAQLNIDIISINALYPFNIWNSERAAQADSLAELASACGAKALVLCPLNDGNHVEQSAEKSADLRHALSALKAILDKHQIKGLVEPLGFPISSLRFKQEAIEAIEAIDASDCFSVVHDTFHHRGAAEQSVFAQQTGLVHISGLEDQDISFNDMLDGHRVLVGPKDRLGNIEQIKQLHNAGYQGLVSFEPFSPAIWDLEDPISAVAQSISYIRQACEQ